MPQSSQTAARISASPAFYALASSIDERIPSDAAAQMLAAFRNVVREATLREVADWFESIGETNAAYLIRTVDVPQGGAR